MTQPFMVVENHRKSLIQHCEVRLRFEWTACSQTVLPDTSILTKNNGKIQM